jgi:[acyl-carrier-protein] S-malonyltransferase
VRSRYKRDGDGVLESTPAAVLFPGQGSQQPRMRDLVESVRPDLVAQVTALVGADPFAQVEESTRFAQPAIFCASLAGWERVRDHVDPVAFAGHSLGELTALVAAGAIDEHDALRLVTLRGLLMSISGEEAGGGTMLVLLGASPSQAGAIAARHRVSLANDNAPGQVVLSGAPDALDAAHADAASVGLRTVELDVAGAFHSPQMQDAVIPFREALAEIEFREPSVPVISCATALPFVDPREELAAALVRPVRWRETMSALAAEGVQTFVDAGPGRVLAKLAARCVPGAGAASLDMLLGGDVRVAA